MTRLTPYEKKRRQALKLAKAFDFYCPVCSALEGVPCQNTGRAKKPGTLAAEPHKQRRLQAFGYLALRDWRAPSVKSDYPTRLDTPRAQAAWREFVEAL